MSVTVHAIVLDCTDAVAVAAFWSQVLDRRVDEGATTDFASIADSPGRPGWMFVKVPEPKATKNRVHVDLGTTDLDAELIRLRNLGATQLAAREEDGTRWVTLADPEGNELDLVAIAG